MKHSLTCFLSALFMFSATSQPLQKHQGKLSNGYTDAGEISYTYRTDPKTREQIKNGTFRYNVKAKDDQYRFYHSIVGNYKDHSKDGIWSYKINQKDFRLQHKELYTTGTISLEAQYKMGLPDGTWRYESSLKNRAGIKKQDKWQWEKHDSAETVSATLNFREGLITGHFHAKNGRQFEVTGSFDEHGFFDGDWTWIFPDSIIAYRWDHGLEVRMEVTDKEGNILHLEDLGKNIKIIRDYQETYLHADPSKTKEYSFSLDTLSLLRERSHLLYRFIQETIYHPQYVLSKEIGGDKVVFYDQQRYQMRFALKGMYTIKLINRISTSQVQYYSRIETLISRMEGQLNHIYQMRRDGKLNKSAGDVIKLMEFNLSMARRYSCIGETIKLYIPLNEGLDAAEASCVYLKASIEKMPSFKTKEEALKYFSEKITTVEKQNEVHYNNLRKNLQK